MNKTTTSFNN